jgi:hypothetical protein
MTTLPPPIADLAAWVGQDIASDDLRAGAVLSAASSLVSGYAGKDWSVDEAPDDVAAIVVQVAARVWSNPTGAVSWTKGPFSERYTDNAALGLYLTEAEQTVLNRFRTVASGLGTLSVTRGEGESDTIYVPTGPAPAGYPFPFYAADGY